MLKIGQNWGKIATYPPPMLNKDRYPWLQYLATKLICLVLFELPQTFNIFCERLGK